jgi:hypothetical protein
MKYNLEVNPFKKDNFVKVVRMKDGKNHSQKIKYLLYN